MLDAEAVLLVGVVHLPHVDAIEQVNGVQMGTELLAPVQIQ